MILELTTPDYLPRHHACVNSQAVAATAPAAGYLVRPITHILAKRNMFSL